jgi:hypothetical protein
MSRRIIYIKNPSSGSHFRNIGGGRAGAPTTNPKQPKAPLTPKAPKIPKSPDYADNGMSGANGYMPGYQAPSNWFIHTPSEAALNFGSYDGPGVGPYEQVFTPTFTPAETLLGEIYDIFTGVAPGGNIQWEVGDPGVLKYMEGGLAGDLATEAAGRNATESNPFFYQGTGQVANNYLNPNRNKKRPWWAR